MGVDAVQLSKTVSHALRHEPWLYELELDDDGWVNVEALLAALRDESPAWRNLTERDLADMIQSSSKQRHELVCGRIRALYGHSLPGRLHRTPAAPPACLFHGTSPVVVASIRRDGLLPMGRQYIHLSTDRETAIAVGRRKSPEPAVLVVKAHAAWQAGLSFYEGNEKVWLADRVPPTFIE
jgi:putative RNA 2'-phosphotransferase